MQLNTGIDEDVRRSRPPYPTRPADVAGPTRPRRSDSSSAQRPSQVPVRAESDPDGITTGGGDTGSGAATTPSASLTLSNDTYTDTAEASKKKTFFNATWSGGAREDYVIVNWLKGFQKDDEGKPFPIMMYGKLVDFDFADWQVDSKDEDPAYWSKDGVRWRYNVDGPHKFSAYDTPGPLETADGAGAQAKVSFKTAVYKNADVPATTTGSLAATPLSSFQPWEYNVAVQGGGKFKH
jgi:hypothetical protein